MIILPWPSSDLSGHNNGNPWVKAKIVASHRAAAFHATRAAKVKVPADGDITLSVRFVPPNNRGDRLNYLNRMKPYYDGIAEALGINDARFAIPSFEVAGVEKPGRVEVQIVLSSPVLMGETDKERFTKADESATKNAGRTSASTLPGPDQNDEVTPKWL